MTRATHSTLARTAAALALLAALGLPAAAHAADPVQCEVLRSDVRCRVDLRAAFDDDIVQRLKSGFQNTFLYRIYVRRADTGEPVALTARRNLQLYELWEDVYYIYEGGSRADARQLSDPLRLVEALAVFDARAAEALPPGRYYADVIVELNPLSEAEEAEIRSWIARSRGGHRTFATGDRSFFGTFVSLFINIRPGSAERTFRQQSKAFEVAP